MNIFPPDSPAQFSKANFTALLNASALAYGDPDGGSDVDHIEATGAKVFFDPVTKTLCFVSVQGNKIVVGFQGTKNRREFITDLSAWKVARPSGYRVHAGFNIALGSVYGDLLRYLNSVITPDSEIWLTGHSLGGALAKLCALRLHEFGLKVSGVYTFGQPRVFDVSGAKIYSSALGAVTFRCRDKADGIPLVPLAIDGFHHSETLIYFDALGNMHIDPAWWFMICSDLVDIYWEWKMGHKIAALNEHGIANYFKL